MYSDHTVCTKMDRPMEGASKMGALPWARRGGCDNRAELIHKQCHQVIHHASSSRPLTAATHNLPGAVSVVNRGGRGLGRQS